MNTFVRCCSRRHMPPLFFIGHDEEGRPSVSPRLAADSTARTVSKVKLSNSAKKIGGGGSNRRTPGTRHQGLTPKTATVPKSKSKHDPACNSVHSTNVDGGVTLEEGAAGTAASASGSGGGGNKKQKKNKKSQDAQFENQPLPAFVQQAAAAKCIRLVFCNVATTG